MAATKLWTTALWNITIGNGGLSPKRKNASTVVEAF